MADAQQDTGGELLEQTHVVEKEPTRYRVILHNDDYTTMDFVIEILESVFQKSPAEAYRLMMQVHTQGHAICGVYTWEIAETKVEVVHDRARENGFPLRASIEEE